MTEIRQCPQCRTALPPSAPQGFCPVCEFGAALHSPSKASNRHDEAPLGTDQIRNRKSESEEVPTLSDLKKVRYFGDYELLEEIAHGGMGTVFKARQITLNRLVALKLISAGVFASQDVVKRFKSEAEAAGGLDHPNIVPIYDIGEQAGQHYFSMPLIDGPTLGQALNRKPLPPRRAAQMMVTVAQAVHFAHQRGLLHRDLKPSNILLDARGEPHLTDFGLAKVIQKQSLLTHTDAVMGTPAYMSPEQARGDAKAITTASDVYGLGAVLYEALTGAPPFAGGTSLETIRQVLEQEPRRPSVFNPQVDRDLETICLKCLEKDPERRYSSAQALAEDLERWQRHEPILARPAGPIFRVSRWARRNPVGASLILSLCLGLAVLLALLKMVLHEKQSAEQARLAADRAREIIWQEIGVSDFWEKPDSTATVSSEILALVTGSNLAVPATEKTERFRIGMLLEEYPVEVIIGYAHLLVYLEKHLSAARGHWVRFDLKLYQKNKTGIDALLRHEVDILKIGGQSYLRANKADPAVTPLLSQRPAKNGVIFTRKDSDVKALADLKNRCIAVGDANSTIRLWATFYLVQAGIPATNMKSFEQPEGDPASTAARLRRAPKVGKSQKISDRSPPIQAVLSRTCDAGAVSEKVLERTRATNAPLVVLKTFPSSPVYWLASSSLPGEIARAFQQAMVSLADPLMFNRLSDHVSSYAEVSGDELKALRQAASLVTEQAGEENEEKE